MSAVDIVSIMKDFVLMAGSSAGVYLAATNLNTWKKQLAGQSDHALARNLLVHLFKYRSAVERVRHPFMSSLEMGIDEELAKDGVTFEKAQYAGTVKAYNARWKVLTDEKAELQAYVVEARALWGEEFADKFKVLAPFELDLYQALDMLVRMQSPNLPAHTKKSLEEQYAKKSSALDVSDDPNNDAFMNKFNDKYFEIESLLRSKLNIIK